MKSLLNQKQKLKGKIDFRKMDILNITDLNGEFDIIYTERVIINLMSWDAQKKAIINILSMLKPNGMFLMCENSEDGLNEINNWRAALNLKSIEMPWHNRYLKDSEISEIRIADVSLEEIDYYSSTYYLLSRVLNAALARDSGLEPSYESPINQMALKLPSIGKFGQGRIWVWRKKQPKAIGD
jgi:SAM-dependent methyltransferase